MILYCRPSDIVSSLATLSLTAGTAEVNFPLLKAQDAKAHTIFKSTGSSFTVRSVFGSAQTLEGLVLVNQRLASGVVTVTNTAGLNQSMPIPANSEDGHNNAPWLDFRGLANTTSTTWDIAVTGLTGVGAIGEIVWITNWRELPFIPDVEEPESHLTIIHTTDGGVRLKYPIGARVRGFAGRVIDAFYLPDILSLQRSARGPYSNFVIIPEPTENLALYVDLTTVQRQISRIQPQEISVRLEFTEQSNGLAL